MIILSRSVASSKVAWETCGHFALKISCQIAMFNRNHDQKKTSKPTEMVFNKTVDESNNRFIMAPTSKYSWLLPPEKKLTFGDPGGG